MTAGREDDLLRQKFADAEGITPTKNVSFREKTVRVVRSAYTQYVSPSARLGPRTEDGHGEAWPSKQRGASTERGGYKE